MRADKYFAEKFGSRTKSAQAIEKGLVLVNGKQIRVKDEIKETDEFTFLKEEQTFVSNGGYKLESALKAFGFNCKQKVFVDIGASTGGFSDCLLQRGAQKIYAIDVGESLLHSSIAENPKVVVRENTNARYLNADDFEETIDCVVTDVSFISLRLIFPAIANVLKGGGEAFVLIKPQFECEKKNIGKSGIVHTSAHNKIVEKVVHYAIENGLYPVEIINAPVRKGKNVEYVLHVTRTKDGRKSIAEIVKTVEDFLENEWKAQETI